MNENSCFFHLLSCAGRATHSFLCVDCFTSNVKKQLFLEIIFFPSVSSALQPDSCSISIIKFLLLGVRSRHCATMLDPKP